VHACKSIQVIFAELMLHATFSVRFASKWNMPNEVLVVLQFMTEIEMKPTSEMCKNLFHRLLQNLQSNPMLASALGDALLQDIDVKLEKGTIDRLFHYASMFDNSSNLIAIAFSVLSLNFLCKFFDWFTSFCRGEDSLLALYITFVGFNHA
jgi:hypothetical protein